jgi:Rieske Fe-S protein
MPDGRPLEEQPKWRHDFPVDTGREEDIERRDFVKFLVLVSGAFATGQVWILGKELMERDKPAPPAMPIARVADLQIGSAYSFNYPGPDDPCLLVRLDEKKFLAYDQKCSHLSCAVLPRVAEGSLECPCHHGSFDLMTGRPTAGPPRRPLAKIIVEVRNDTVYATGVERRT